MMVKSVKPEPPKHARFGGGFSGNTRSSMPIIGNGKGPESRPKEASGPEAGGNLSLARRGVRISPVVQPEEKPEEQSEGFGGEKDS